MKITLNEAKTPMCGIGKKVFLNYDNPGPVEVDPKSLDRQELTQLVMLIRMQQVKVDDLTELNKILEGLQKSEPQKTAPPPTQRMPVITRNTADLVNTALKEVGADVQLKEHTIDEFQEQELQELKQLLSGSMPSVKKAMGSMSPSKIRKLLKLESEGQKRKGLINLANDLLAQHTKAVTDKIGTEDMGMATEASKSEIGKGMRGVILDNISDVVESDVTSVTVK